MSSQNFGTAATLQDLQTLVTHSGKKYRLLWPDMELLLDQHHSSPFWSQRHDSSAPCLADDYGHNDLLRCHGGCTNNRTEQRSVRAVHWAVLADIIRF